MSDLNKVAFVAEHVMKWKCYHDRGESVRFDSDGLAGFDAIIYHDSDGSVQAVRRWDGQQSFAWNPLGDWNDAMEIVDAFALMPFEKGALFQMFLMKDGFWYADIDKPDIVEAAVAFAQEIGLEE